MIDILSTANGGKAVEVVHESRNVNTSESCKCIWKDRNCVVEHDIKNIKIFFCLNCEDWVNIKENVLNEGWTLFDEGGNLRMDV